MDGPITVELMGDARRFADLAGPWLAADPFTTTRIGTVLEGVLRGSFPVEDDALWIAAIAGGSAVGAAMHVTPHFLQLPRLPAGVAGAIGTALLNAGRPVAGVSGESAAVSELSAVWEERSGGGSQVVMRSRMYRLGDLTPPARIPGDARPARAEDAPLLIDWFERFHDEATPSRPLESPDRIVARRTVMGELWLWWDRDRPVAVAGHSVPVSGVARVGPVYTPPEWRRHGYGAAVTRAATRAALRAGAEHVVLFADVANPTAGAVYQALGYRAEHEAEERRFTR